VSPNELSDIDNVTGIANQVTELDMINSPRDGSLVPIVMHYGIHVCWGCMEPFDADDPKLRLEEFRAPGATVRVAIHRKCADPKNRKIFSDRGENRELQSVAEVSRGLRIRKAVAKAVQAVQPFVQSAGAAASKIIL
jgi:hypothetical protein